MRSISIENLSEEINDILEIYGKDVQSGINRAGAKASKRLQNITTSTAPIGAGSSSRPHFAESISIKTEQSRLGDKRFIWYVKAPNYRLTHLIVHGHLKRNGGRTRGNPFLKDALNSVLPEYEKDVKEVIRNGK